MLGRQLAFLHGCPGALVVPAEKCFELRVGTSVVTAIGVPLLAVGLTYDRRQQPSEGFDLDFTGVGLTIVGGVMLIVGVIGMAASGAVMGASKQELRELEEARHERRRRAQWDLARSRLVF